MPSFKIAHVKERGVDLIIVPLESAFGRASAANQRRQIEAMQIAATSAGLAGTVVPVWDNGGGRMGFIAPQQWHAFFRGLDLFTVGQNLNRTLSW